MQKQMLKWQYLIEILHCTTSQILALFSGSKMALNWIKGKWDDNICCKKYSLVMLNVAGT